MKDTMVMDRKKQIDIEEEIRPIKRQKVNFALLDLDIEELMMPFTESFLTVDCPNCNSVDSSESFKKGGFSFCLCPDCDMVFVNPRPSKKLLDEFYANSKAFHGTTMALYENEAGRKKHIFVPRANIILNFLKEMGMEKGDLLDVGCSIGTMLSIIKEQSDLNVYGVDPSPVALEITRKRELKVFPKTIEEFESGEMSFDVVLSFETIEHLFWPTDFLEKINKIMNKGGYFIFSTPNYHGYDILTLGTHYKRTRAPFHLNYFNVDTIDSILESTGFKIVKKMTPGILDIINVRKQVEEGNAPQIDAFTKYLLFTASSEVQNNFQKFLSENCLSGNMLIFAQKIDSTR